MTDAQYLCFRKRLPFYNMTAFHHGDCIGADEEAHNAVRAYNLLIPITVHPPTDDSRRAFKQGDFARDPTPFLERNRHIVEASEILIACPATETETKRSGTWSTIRYAAKQGREIHIILPNGIVEERL